MKKHTQVGLIAVVVSMLVFGAVVAQRLLGEKGVAIANSKGQDILQRIEDAQEQSIQLDGNGNAPLFVQEATVKEISAEDFSKLTGKIAAASRIFSLPQARLLNTSGKAIKEFSVMVRNEKTQLCTIFTFRDRDLKPGEYFQVRREDLIKPETSVSSKADGKTVAKTVKPGWESDRMWINTDLREVYLAIAHAKYDDGTEWIIQ